MNNETKTDAIEQLGTELVGAMRGAVDYLSELAQEYDDWKQTLLRRSNDGLYDLLAKCLRVYEIMTEDSDNGTRLRRELGEHVKASKLKFNGDTHTVVKIARIVFAADSKKASAYGMVLRAAIEQGINHAALPTFIRQRGGVENLRLFRGRSAETVEQKAERVWRAVKGMSLTVAVGDELKKATDTAKVGARVVLLATQQAGGEFAVHAVMQADGAVNAAFAAYASSIAKASGNDEAEVEVASQQDARAELRAKAARELLSA